MSLGGPELRAVAIGATGEKPEPTLERWDALFVEALSAGGLVS